MSFRGYSHLNAIFNTKPFTFFVCCLHCWQNRLQKMDNGQNKTCISLATRITPITITGRHFVHYFKVASYSGDKTNYTHIHTHLFNSPLSGTTQVSRYQKGKTNLDFTEASCSSISWAICKSAHRSRQITMPTPTTQFFTGRMPFLPPNQQCQSTEGTHTHARARACVCLQCFDTVGWAAGRASGL